MITKEVIEKVVEPRLVSGDSLRTIAKDLGVTYQTLQYHRRILGCPLIGKTKTKGEGHASWKGGSFIDRWGYKMVRTPDRKCCNPYTPEHILVMEKHIGRQLRKNKEVVHHINGIKSDNRIENLLLCTKSEHRILHRQLESIGYQLIRNGQITFKDGEYILCGN